MVWHVSNAAPRARGRILRELVWMGFMLPKKQRRIHGTRTGPPNYTVAPMKQPKTVSFEDEVRAQEPERTLAPIMPETRSHDALGLIEAPTPEPEVAPRGLSEASLEATEDTPKPFQQEPQGVYAQPTLNRQPTRSCLITSSPRIRPDGAGRLAWDCPTEGRILLHEYTICMRESPDAEHRVREDAREIEGKEGHNGLTAPAYKYCLRVDGLDARYPVPQRRGQRV